MLGLLPLPSCHVKITRTIDTIHHDASPERSGNNPRPGDGAIRKALVTGPGFWWFFFLIGPCGEGYHVHVRAVQVFPNEKKRFFFARPCMTVTEDLALLPSSCFCKLSFPAHPALLLIASVPGFLVFFTVVLLRHPLAAIKKTSAHLFRFCTPAEQKLLCNHSREQG
ncbi:hypothetical protein VTN96DRAFT_10213 [Rasamsonia emersonii]